MSTDPIDHRAEAERLLADVANTLRDTARTPPHAELRVNLARIHATLHVGDMLARVVGLLEPLARPQRILYNDEAAEINPAELAELRRLWVEAGGPTRIPLEPWRAEWLARRGPISDRAAGCRWCSTGATASPCVCDPPCEWSACIARAVAPPASATQGGETPSTHTRVTKEPSGAAETTTADRDTQSRPAGDGYRWQWSADGGDPWTFAAGTAAAREAAGPDGFVRRVSRLDGTPGRIMKANPGVKAWLGGRKDVDTEEDGG